MKRGLQHFSLLRTAVCRQRGGTKRTTRMFFKGFFFFFLINDDSEKLQTNSSSSIFPSCRQCWEKQTRLTKGGWVSQSTCQMELLGPSGTARGLLVQRNNSVRRGSRAWTLITQKPEWIHPKNLQGDGNKQSCCCRKLSIENEAHDARFVHF